MFHLVASAVIPTRLQRAPVHDLLASAALESPRTIAFVVEISVATRRSVLTWTRIASIDSRLTVRSGVAIWAVTFVVVDEVFAGAAVHAGSGRAVFVVDLTIRS